MRPDSVKAGAAECRESKVADTLKAAGPGLKVLLWRTRKGGEGISATGAEYCLQSEFLLSDSQAFRPTRGHAKGWRALHDVGGSGDIVGAGA